MEDIYIVIGYMKEKFFYLEQKYGVHLLVNNYFGSRGNVYSLYVARENLGNTFICCVDHYFTKNPFTYENEQNESYRACAYLKGKFREFAVSVSDANVITDMEVGGADSLAMVGHAYINEQFGEKYREFLENEINDFGVAQMFWEQFFKRHIKELTFYKREFDVEDVLEFESIDDLREFDSEFLLNVDSEIITNICSVLNCDANDITDIAVINAGLTNVSFSFAIEEEKYVYRHPGGTAGIFCPCRRQRCVSYCGYWHCPYRRGNHTVHNPVLSSVQRGVAPAGSEPHAACPQCRSGADCQSPPGWWQQS